MRAASCSRLSKVEDGQVRTCTRKESHGPVIDGGSKDYGIIIDCDKAKKTARRTWTRRKTRARANKLSQPHARNLGKAVVSAGVITGIINLGGRGVNIHWDRHVRAGFRYVPTRSKSNCKKGEGSTSAGRQCQKESPASLAERVVQVLGMSIEDT
ncbi:hypothetical protein GALMADRAFT_1103066 [Galerina marginata CBS 339.88]|uniref:Uncharacterized protein n=1 Tax=Galerina marginata (strain CBS 339.88) TaxID=685588 RepID=A0A067TBX7_GALM3|nr:hypothetical protein GALMADRAFT_1103066 [Galerina marginata CBS 339.88]